MAEFEERGSCWKPSASACERITIWRCFRKSGSAVALRTFDASIGQKVWREVILSIDFFDDDFVLLVDESRDNPANRGDVCRRPFAVNLGRARFACRLL